MFLSLIQKIPVVTTFFSLWFFLQLYRHYRRKPYPYLGWWCLGVLTYGAGTFTESFTSLFGWQEPVFKAWYITGALLGGFPLAQGTAYLLFKRKTADVLSIVFTSVIVITSLFVIFSPILPEMVETFRLSGKVLAWEKVRLVSPFVNSYSFFVLVGGAVYSALLYYRRGPEYRPRFQGNVLIALGGLLPGIGGSFTRFGYTEVLYVTELIGIVLIYAGYSRMKKDHTASLHKVQQTV